jgi:RNA polymerase sigma-70 factor (ECF subfamily)
MNEQNSTTQLQQWLNQVRGGDLEARELLIQHACERLRRLTRKMLGSYPAVHRWEQTDDVMQNALLRLDRALAKVQPETVRGFFQLAAKLIRQELIDLGRHYLGPQGIGPNHASGANLTEAQGQIEVFTRFQELVEGLATEERKVVDLVFYQGMTLAEAAVSLEVSERTVKRRWRSARLALYEQLQTEVPFE